MNYNYFKYNGVADSKTLNKHYKLYRSGKKGLISGITTASMLIPMSFILADKASADEKDSGQEITSISSSVDTSATLSTTSNLSATNVNASSEATMVSSNAPVENNSVSAVDSQSNVVNGTSSTNVNSSVNDVSTSSFDHNDQLSSQENVNNSSNSISSSMADNNINSLSIIGNLSDNGTPSSTIATSVESSLLDNSQLLDSLMNVSGISNRSLEITDDSNSSNPNNVIEALPAGGSYSTDDNGQTWKYVYQNQPLKGLYEDNGNLVYFDYYDGTQAKGSIYNVDNNNYYFYKDSGHGTKIDNLTGGYYKQENVSNSDGSQTNGWAYQTSNGDLAKGIQMIDGTIQYFNPDTGLQIKGGTANVGGTNYYFDPNLGNLVGNVSQVVNSGKYVNNNGVTQYVDGDNNVVKGLTSVDNVLQYFDPNTGEQAKNKQVYTNGATYYFDTNGNGQYLFTNTGNSIIDDTTQHNAANSNNASDYQNTVDGFLTAESWYRPKDILDDGNTWRPSDNDDYRPIITNWWPNKDVQVNYLKLMQDNGLLSNQTQYNVYSDQVTLDQAAQAAQVGIEQRIKQENGTDWLNDLLFKGNTNNPSFVNQQYVWNVNSESPWVNQAWFQGGYLKYGNSVLTPTTNSDYRNSGNTFEFLLANDIDNSNPVVQADNLNWLYYMTHFGSITANNDNANFDSIRLDAVDFVNNDAVQRIYDYMNEEYGLNANDANANKHISLVEAGLDAGATSYNNNALTESPFRETAYSSLFNASGKNAPLTNLIKEYDSGVLVNDHSGDGVNTSLPTYSIIHAHDKGIQEKVGNAITDATGADWTNFTPEQLQAGLNLYYQDQASAIKKYNSYNIPSAYALLLTNNGTVPRVYYGDLYDDNGQYMQNQSIYYDAITSLMEARKTYVSGGQSMSVDNNGLLTSVRYGSDAQTASDTGNADTRTEGIGVIVGNDASLNLNNNATVTLDMGAAHKNQAYRAVLLTTPSGLQTYNSDNNAPVVYTDDNGQLTFSNQNINDQANTAIKGTLNPQVSGYLSAWVPVGASTDQDARTEPSTSTNSDGKILHSNDALNSNLIYEGFSNFQPTPNTPDERANVVIAKNAPLFNSWGITSFEMAPQYKSTDDHTFLDSTINNGYAFSDRYNLGFDSPTKYGDDNDLRNAIQSLHQNGMQVMADMVYNQVYNLPGQEVVSASRAGVYGNDANVPFGTQLYVTNTIGGGKYQQEYAGAFLNKLKEEHPDLFDSKSYNYYYQNYADNGAGPAYLVVKNGTRSAIPSDQPLTQWSAKYMDGTNILGRGMGYVLKDWNSGAYFKISGNDTTLPSKLTYRTGWNENSDGSWSYYDPSSGDRLTGIQEIDDKYVYFKPDGSQVKGGFVNNNGNSYYADAGDGHLATGLNDIDNKKYYFNSDGSQFKGVFLTNDGDWYYADPTDGHLVTGQQTINGQHLFFSNDSSQVIGSFLTDQGNWYYADPTDGHLVTGFQNIDGQNLYFNSDGSQVKGNFVDVDNKQYYTDANDGHILTGQQTINGQHLFFSNDGVQVRGGFLTDQGNWYYADPTDGHLVTGLQNVDGQNLYFNSDGSQVKGAFVNVNNKYYYADAGDGHLLTGFQNIDGQNLYFNSDGSQVKGNFVDVDNKHYYTDANDGHLVTGQQTINGQHLFFSNNGVQVRGGFLTDQGNWYYADPTDGHLVTGLQNINGSNLYFNADGSQVKGNFIDVDNKRYYADAGDGHLVTGQQIIDGQRLFFNNDGSQVVGRFLNDRGQCYYAAPDDGHLVTGFQNIDGQNLYFNSNGSQVKGNFINVNNKRYYTDFNDGHLVTGQQIINGKHLFFSNDGSQVIGGFLTDQGNWYYSSPYDGHLVTWVQNIDGRILYFNPDGTQVKGKFININGKQYYADSGDGHLVTGLQNVDGQNYYFNSDGSQVKGHFLYDHGQRYYADTNDGHLLTGQQNINGQHLFFSNNGAQVRGGFLTDQGNWYYAASGDGHLVTGLQNIDGHNLYFNSDGSQVKGAFVEVNGQRYYADAGDGHLILS